LFLRRVVSPGGDLPAPQFGTIVLVPGDILPNRPERASNLDHNSTITSLDVGVAVPVGRTDVNLSKGVLYFSDFFGRHAQRNVWLKRRIEDCLERIDDLRAQETGLKRLAGKSYAVAKAEKTITELREEIIELEAAVRQAVRAYYLW
jgi:hypothetical protein